MYHGKVISSLLYGCKRLLSGRCGETSRFQTCLRKIIRTFEPKKYTGRNLRAAVLHGPRNMKLETLPEVVVQPDQIRIDVHFCGINGTDVLLWTGEHHRIPEKSMVLGFEVAGTILELGGVAYEKTGYQMGEAVVAHNYPTCGGFADTCLVHYRDVFRLAKRATMKDAAAMIDDYFSSLLALGRRTRVRKGECFLINTNRSRSALAAIDVGKQVLHSKPIVVCNSTTRAELCADLGAIAVFIRDENFISEKLERVTGRGKVRVIIETEGGSYIKDVIKCLEYEGMIAFLSSAKDKKRSELFPISPNCMFFAVAAEHYKNADPLVYRETIEHILDYKAECVIQPEISEIFGLNRIGEAFDYYVTVPSGKVLIDLKDQDRGPLNCEKNHDPR